VEGGEETMRKAFVIIRVSSQDQLKGYGPNVQWFDDVIPNAPLLGLEVSEKYRRVIQESATTWERTKFEGLMREALTLYQNNEIEALLFPRVDRETRFIFGSFPLLCEVVRSGLKVFFARERFELDPNNPESTERYLNKATQAQAYVETLRLNTMRGKRAKALQGKIPGGSGSTIYGYDYVKVSQENGGRRIINETEASWVPQMYQWLVNEGLSSNQILYRLRAHNAPTKSGKIWNRHSVQAILINPAYTGKTYVFTTAKGKQFARPRADWIEIPGATPAIIRQELFDAAQKQLRVNQEKSPRNCKREYLLHGHLRCRQCGRAYVGAITSSIQHSKRYIQRFYRCKGKLKMYAPVERCCNKGWSANKLEAMVWGKLEEYLSKPELIISQLEKQHQDADQLGVFEAELERVERQLKAVDREQHQLLQWALKDFPADQVEAENKRLNKARETLTGQKVGLETQLKASHDAVISIPKLEQFIERMQGRIAALDYEGKRQVLDMLGIKVWLDGESVEITGVIPTEEDAIVPMQS
jgi:DNA invertase Pin-like site-specific DNA recombinase